MENIVPDFILSNPIKIGFKTPLIHIFSDESKYSAAAILLSERCINRGLFVEKAIRKSINDQKLGKANNSRYLFRMLNVELWFREFIDDK